MRTCGFEPSKDITAVDLLWEYINIVKTMDETPGLYHLDDIRTKTHAQLIQMLYPTFKGISRERTEEILMEYLHNLDQHKYNAKAIMNKIKERAKEEITQRPSR